MPKPQNLASLDKEVNSLKGIDQDSTVKEELPTLKDEWKYRDATMTEEGLRAVWFNTYQTVLSYLVSEGLGTLVSVEQKANLVRKLQHAADLADQSVISYVEHRILHGDVVKDSLEHFERMNAR
jgi:hypothetical protein